MNQELNSEIVVSARNISKKFCKKLRQGMAYGITDLSKNIIGIKPDSSKLRQDEFWALDDITFNIKRGEALGIIGANGSGKTTLLRLLNGIFPPDAGLITIKGNVGSLIAVGAGFHPHMTGRENIFLNGTILGMSKNELQSKFDEIVDFSELGDFLDAPVSTYSSGMRVRLGFSVAVKIRPEILMIDEVLSVGDQKFRRKARNEMDKLLNSGVTLIFVSHNMHEVLGITERAIWIDKGKILKDGRSAEVCAEYMRTSIIQTNLDSDFHYIQKRTGDLEVKSVECVMNKKNFNRFINCENEHLKLGKFFIHMELLAKENIDEKIFFLFQLKTSDDKDVGYIVLQEYVKIEEHKTVSITFQMSLPTLHFSQYIMSFEIATDGGALLEGIKNLFYISMKSSAVISADDDYAHERMITASRGGIFLNIQKVR